MTLLKNLFRVSNIGLLLFFALNALFVIRIFDLFIEESRLAALVVYAVSILLALSPLGEWQSCWMIGARRPPPGPADMSGIMRRVAPLFGEVYKTARNHAPSVPKDIILKLSRNPTINACAIGRRTVCVNEGLFRLSDDAVKGILAHEFGHLALGHSLVRALIGNSNFAVTLPMTLLSCLCGGINVLAKRYKKHLRFVEVLAAFFGMMLWWWHNFCELLLKYTSRQNEYDTDAYASALGYGRELAEGLTAIALTADRKMSFLEKLHSTHPNLGNRIERLKKLDASSRGPRK